MRRTASNREKKQATFTLASLPCSFYKTLRRLTTLLIFGPRAGREALQRHESAESLKLCAELAEPAAWRKWAVSSPLLFRIRQMCYKRWSGGLFGALATGRWRPEAAACGTGEGARDGVLVAVLSRMFGSSGSAELQDDLPGLRVLYVLLGLLLRLIEAHRFAERASPQNQFNHNVQPGQTRTYEEGRTWHYE
jgi:hypothetical protein